ncbi:hypothetical protein [Altericista sp. CCNU0014]|uniref:hypothetical protein n=1 Tax=Altericista sp. CCNU0014 TaxID=3082949 RepID=UPI00384E3BAC
MDLNKPLLVYTHGAGRLGNQLFAYAHFVAFLKEHSGQYNFINFAFTPYAKLLKYTSTPLGCTYPTVHRQLATLQNLVSILEVRPKTGATAVLQEKALVNIARSLHAYADLIPNAQSLVAKDIYYWSLIAGQRLSYLDLALPQTVDLLSSKSLSVLAGWGIRSWSLLEKHGDFVREALAFHPQYEGAASTFVRDLRQQYDYLIGVAIRQGDYRSAADFKCFMFETDRYVDWIRQAQSTFSHKGTVGFIVTADEPQDIDRFAGLNVHFATGIAGGSGHFIESLIELSLCDLLMTSGTTFAGWAAFWGNIPILPLYESNQKIRAEDGQHYLEAFKRFDAMGNKIL